MARTVEHDGNRSHHDPPRWGAQLQGRAGEPRVDADPLLITVNPSATHHFNPQVTPVTRGTPTYIKFQAAGTSPIAFWVSPNDGAGQPNQLFAGPYWAEPSGASRPTILKINEQAQLGTYRLSLTEPPGERDEGDPQDGEIRVGTPPSERHDQK